MELKEYKYKYQSIMAINLTKGDDVEIGLSKVGVGLGWEPNEGTGLILTLMRQHSVGV
jgi:hypothetical protein